MRSGRRPAWVCTYAIYLMAAMVAFIILVDVQAARPLSSAVGRHLTQDEPIYIPERIFFEPNNDEDDKVEDYLLNVYIGDVEIAEADPAIAAAGGAAGAGLQLSYENIFDYENPIQQANGGPGAKAVGAAVGRVLGLGSATTKARGSARVNAQYERDTWNSNSVTVGTVAQMSGGASGGLYLDRNEANENDALLETVEPNNFVFG